MLLKSLTKVSFSFYSSRGFKDLPVSPPLMQRLSELPFEKMTAVQDKVISHLLKHPDKHTHIVSETGSGKTLAFLIPVAQQILANKTALILTHCKQLSLQTYKTAKLLGISSVLRLGSLHYYRHSQDMQNKQERTLNKSIESSLLDVRHDLTIATPAQVHDILLNKLQKHPPSTIVIDQADLLTVIDQNLKKQTSKIVQKLRAKTNARVVLASAFYPIQKQTFLKLNFEVIRQRQLPATLKQYFVDAKGLNQQSQMNMLLQIVKLMEADKKTLVIFCNSQAILKQVSKRIKLLGIQCSQLYAELNASQRLEAVNKNGILVATDVGSRGLDFKFDAVVQFEFATNIVSYVNRVGRTARGGRPGQAYGFVREEDQQFSNLIKQRRNRQQSLVAMFSRKRSLSKGGFQL